MLLRHVVVHGILASCLFTLPASVHAEYPDACEVVQSCVDAAIPSINDSCLAATPACDVSTFESNRTSARFGVSSGAIADNAAAIAAKRLELSSCEGASTKKKCQACFKYARKKVLAPRYLGSLLKGLFGNATGLLAKRSSVQCAAIGN